MVDSHAHLDFPEFDADRPAVLERAREAGVSTIVNVGTDAASSRAAVNLAAEHSVVYASVGLHPHSAEDFSPAILAELRSLVVQPKVVAIGEIGLDYYRDYASRTSQRRAFAALLSLAAEFQLPVIVHAREAYEDVWAALREWDGPGGVVHAYSGGLAWMDRLLELGFHLGIAGPVTFPNARVLRSVVAAAPLERLLMETDCPYLAPVPCRGQRNEPAYVGYIAEAIARVRDLAPSDVVCQTTVNARRLFGLDIRAGSHCEPDRD